MSNPAHLVPHFGSNRTAIFRSGTPMPAFWISRLLKWLSIFLSLRQNHKIVSLDGYQPYVLIRQRNIETAQGVLGVSASTSEGSSALVRHFLVFDDTVKKPINASKVAGARLINCSSRAALRPCIRQTKLCDRHCQNPFHLTA